MSQSCKGSDAGPRPRPHRTATASIALGRCTWTVAASLLLGVAGSTLAITPAAEIAAENRKCANCHGQARLGQMTAAQRGVMVRRDQDQTLSEDPASAHPGLVVTTQTLAASVHDALACIDCHQDAATLPHAQELAPVTCDSGCHETQQVQFRRGRHAEVLAAGHPQAPACSTCHGSHDILPADQRQSRTYPLNVVRTCGDCHRQHADADGAPGAGRVESYLGSVHGKALNQAGLIVAATCADCHGAHAVLAAADPQSTVHRDAVPDTCGACHVGITEVYEKSIHGQKLAAGDPRAPVCSDCHTAHGISRAGTPAFMLDIVNECAGCHDAPGAGRRSSFYRTYRQSYHGQVTRLGETRAARCSDCHGAHDILPIVDPDSRLHADHRINVCRDCHPQADAKFASFEPHADYRDAAKYPLLHGVWLYFVIMMSFAFGFFGLHSVLWFVRSLIERLRHGPVERYHPGEKAIRRFTRFDRINHALVVITFFGLTITGLPLLFSDQPWAGRLAAMLGGVAGAGLLHRFFAILLIANFLAHAWGVLKRFRAHHAPIRGLLFGPTTMLPRVKDVQDCVGMWRWFFRGGDKPRFDRWTYWEKFDYVAEVGGSVIIGVSGLVLWFPVFFSHYLPGWAFNVAMIVHGYEAMLAIGFIFTIHFFNAHLRMEKFPVDDVMFSGCLPEEEFKHERPAEYERLLASGRLDEHRVDAPPRWYRPVAVLWGAAAMTVGMTLVVLIILAGLGAL